jgi:hypothetical protein
MFQTLESMRPICVGGSSATNSAPSRWLLANGAPASTPRTAALRRDDADQAVGVAIGQPEVRHQDPGPDGRTALRAAAAFDASPAPTMSAGACHLDYSR